ncbi:MAG: hypothetical protein WC662_03275 [Candidatus Paceibacterota bacterium]|jgi:hypothetical protein
MRKIIHKLRQKPEEERRHLLHFFIFVVAIILIVLWVYSLDKRLTSQETKIKLKEDLQPFSVLKDNLVGGYKSMGDSSSE